MIRDLYQGLLFVGDAPTARDAKILYDHDIKAVVDVAANELAAQLPRELIYCRIPLLDGDGNSLQSLKIAVTTVVSLLKAQIPILVACSAGMSRSPAICAAALAVFTGDSADQCLLRIVESGPHDVSPLLWSRLKTACDLV